MSQDLTHGVAVWVVLEGVLPDEVRVRHELSDGDVLVLVDVGQQRGEVHGLPDHHHVVRDLEDIWEISLHHRLPPCWLFCRNT